LFIVFIYCCNNTIIGIFAEEDIPKGTLVYIFDINNHISYDEKALLQKIEEIKQQYNNNEKIIDFFNHLQRYPDKNIVINNKINNNYKPIMLYVTGDIKYMNHSTNDYNIRCRDPKTNEY